jgi:hypothetical protein
MRVGVDDNGYFYDLDTGLYLTVAFDDLGNPYNAATNEPIDYLDLSGIGGPADYTVTAGGNLDLNNLVNVFGQAIVGVAGGAGRTGHYIPLQSGQPSGQFGGAGGQMVRTQGSAGPGGIGGSLNISTNTLMLIVGGVLLFMLGGRRR